MNLARAGRVAGIALVVLFVLLIVLPVSLPAFVIDKINEKLATSSETVLAQIEGLDFTVIRSSYRIQGLTVKSKVIPRAPGFLRLETARISLAWRELFRGAIRADVDINGLDVAFGHEMYSLQNANSTAQKSSDAKDILSHLVPIDVDLVNLQRSRIRYEYARDKKIYNLFTELQGQVSHISSRVDRGDLPSLISLRGNFFDNASATVTGRMLPQAKPLALELQIKIQKFDVTKSNPFLYDLVPFTFAKGELTAFSELKLEQNEVHGYVKPFFRNIQIISSGEKFKDLKQLGLEIVAGVSNVLLKNRGSSNSTSAQIQFDKTGDRWNILLLKTFTSAVKHGYIEPLKEDFDNTVHIKGLEKFD